MANLIDELAKCLKGVCEKDKQVFWDCNRLAKGLEDMAALWTMTATMGGAIGDERDHGPRELYRKMAGAAGRREREIGREWREEFVAGKGREKRR